MSWRYGTPRGPSGVVLNIQRFCVADGPGTRTTVFLKGCSQRCAWCSNPESIAIEPELAYEPRLCLGEKDCGACLGECPEQALLVLPTDGKVRVNWDLCTSCGACVPACPTKALSRFGRRMTVDEVLAEAWLDGPEVESSGAGLTISGGECLLQAEFCVALLAEARRRGIHTAIETAGECPWEAMAAALPYADLVLHDHKLTDAARHAAWTGVGNARIRDNYRRAYQAFPGTPFIARSPVVPGVNDDEAHVRGVLAFIRPYPNVIDYQLVPYHRYRQPKYAYLGRIYALADFAPPAEGTLQHLQAIIDQAFGRRSMTAGEAAQAAREPAAPATPEPLPEPAPTASG